MSIPRHVISLLFTAAIAVLITAMVVTALGFREAARTAPLVVGIPTAVFLFIQLIRDAVRVKHGDQTVGATAKEEEDRYLEKAGTSGVKEALASTEERSTQAGDRSTSMLGAIGWVVLLALTIWLVGMLIAIPIFLLAFMRGFGGERWLTILAFAVGTTAAVYAFFIMVLEVRLYTGVFGDLIPFL